MEVALSGGLPDRVPIWEFGFYCMDKATGRHLVLGREFSALTEAGRDKALHDNAETIAMAAEMYDFAAVTIVGPYWEVAPGEPAYYWLPDSALMKQAALIKKAVGPERMLVGKAGGTIGMPPAQDFEDFCIRLLEAPEEIDEQARRMLPSGLEAAARLKEAGVDVICTASDIADNRGPFFRPQQMQRFILPYLREWAAGIKRMGLYAIMHTDGNLHPILDELADTGIHALQAVDPVAGMDMAKAQVEARGRIALCGNIDCGLLLMGPAERIYEKTRALLEACGRRGGLVLGASNGIFPETPREHYEAVHRAWRDFGDSS